MELDFNACLTLLVIGLVFALIVVRCLLAVVDRGFLLVDYAQENLYPGGKKAGGKFGLMDIVGTIFEAGKPAIEAGVQKMLGVAKK